MKRFKNGMRFFWLLLVVMSLLCYFIYPDYFTADAIKKIFNNNSELILIVYIVLSCVRAMLLLPSTIFVLMGTVLYPENPWFVLVISMVGILLGATLIYYSSMYLAPEKLFKDKNLTRMEGIRTKMERYGFFIVFFWSFFPAVPTDLICFIAGTIRMSFFKFLLAIFLGEVILVSLYIWTGKTLLSYFF